MINAIKSADKWFEIFISEIEWWFDHYDIFSGIDMGTLILNDRNSIVHYVVQFEHVKIIIKVEFCVIRLQKFCIAEIFAETNQDHIVSKMETDYSPIE